MYPLRVAPTGTERRLAAILLTDIVGYTALMGRDEAAGRRARERHRALVVPLVEQYRGQVIEARGDETLSVFPSTLDAVHCALAIEDALAEEADLRLHLGIHTGDVVVQAGEVAGDGVNIAARICSLREEGGLCVSGEVHRAIRNQPDIAAVPLGERRLKNVDHPVAVYAVGRPGAVARPRVRMPGPRMLAAGALAAALAGVLSATAWWGWDSASPASGPGPVRSIAVLPLANLSGDPEQEYFADGMTEALISDLAKIDSFQVISRTSVMRYEDARRPLREIARELEADVVVEGSVLRADDRVRITAQLVDAGTDRHLWAESYERDLRDILALQAEVAQAIAREIEHELTPRERARFRADRTVDPVAYDATLKGLQLVSSARHDGHRRSVAYFEQALEADPDYALAYAGLAWAYTCGCLWSLPSEGMTKARDYAQKALELEPELALAHVMVAGVQLHGDWDFERAEAGFRRALELDPGSVIGHKQYSNLLAFTDRIEEAIEHLEIARDLDPLAPDPGYTDLGFLYEVRGESGQAVAAWTRMEEQMPGYLQPLLNRGSHLCRTGRPEEALALFEQALARGDPWPAANLAWCQAISGRREDARATLAELAARAEREYVTPVALALVHVGLGDVDAAFEALERAYALRSLRILGLALDPRWEPLRSDPRYRDLVWRIGLPAG